MAVIIGLLVVAVASSHADGPGSSWCDGSSILDGAVDQSDDAGRLPGETA